MSYKIPLESKEMLESRMIELVKNHLEISISTDISDFENNDCTIYNESTADGYDVFVVTNDTRNVSVCENVFYYDHDIADQFSEQIRYGDRTFYIDDGIYEDCYIEDKLLELFAEYVEDIIENEELDITLEEIEYLKEEYELIEEVTNSQLAQLSTFARTQKVRAFRGMRTFDKYKENLREHNGDIWSYSTKVAEIKDDGKLHQLGWWSVTTQKHINYAAKELGLELVK